MRTYSTGPGISCGGLPFGDPSSALLGGEAGASRQERLLRVASLHLPLCSQARPWTKPMPGVSGGTPRSPQDFAPSPCSPCRSRAGAWLSWAPFPQLPLPRHPKFAAPGLNSVRYHRRARRSCQAALVCKKSMQPSLLIKGCPAGAGPTSPGWLLLQLPLCPPCRDRHLG